MTKAYYLKVLDDIVKDSKYFQNEAIDLVSSLSLFIMIHLVLFLKISKEDDGYLVSNMVVELNNYKILWYNCTNYGDKKKDKDFISLSLQLFWLRRV